MRQVKINVDRSIEEVNPETDMASLKMCHEYICFELDMLTIFNDGKTIISLVVDDFGLNKELDLNPLATSVRGMLRLQDRPLVGPAVMVAADGEGETIDVPDIWIKLLQTIIQITQGV